MFIDERLLTVRSGAGGNGIVAWHREKFVPFGGPGGGDGGDGGDVVFVADPELTTFSDMEQMRRLRAPDGLRGLGKRKTGKQGEDRVLLLPLGTSIYDGDTGELLIDLSEPGLRWIAAQGGRGGRGNSRFATATDQRPTRAEPGEPGIERNFRLELRLLADVGLVGLPNAGKSTLMARLTSARPKVAAYPFTTLEPFLGLVNLPYARRFVLADLPGLIEGAHQGRGLGDRFLRHIERTRVLLHLVDINPPDGSDPAEAYKTLRRELKAYGHGLTGRPEVVAATKLDTLPEGPERTRALSRLSKAVDRKVVPISAVAGTGLKELLAAVVSALDRAAPPAGPPPRSQSTAGEPPAGGPEGPGCSTTSFNTST